MAKLELFPIAPWIRFYSNLSVRTLDRVQKALHEVENERYKPENFISDTVHFWNEVATGWWTSLQQAVPAAVPTAFVRIRKGDQNRGTKVTVDCSGKGEPEMSPVVRLGNVSNQKGPQREPLSQEHLELELNPGRTQLSVNVKGLQGSGKRKGKIADQPQLAPGLYQSLVHMDEKLIAVLQILVTD